MLLGLEKRPILGAGAVQLTEMANRVWKRTSDDEFILAERRRLLAHGPAKAGRYD